MTIAYCPGCRTPRLPGTAFCGGCGLDYRPLDARATAPIATDPDSYVQAGREFDAKRDALDAASPDERGTEAAHLRVAPPASDNSSKGGPDIGAARTHFGDGAQASSARSEGPAGPLSESRRRPRRAHRNGAPGQMASARGFVPLVVALTTLLTAGGAAWFLWGSLANMPTSALPAATAAQGSLPPTADPAGGPGISRAPGMQQAETSTPTSAGPAWDPSEIDRLLAITPRALVDTCMAGPPGSDGSYSPMAVAVIECQPSGTPNRVLYEVFDNGQAAYERYQGSLGQAGLVTNAGGCWNGTPGEVAYSDGRAACWSDSASGTTQIGWLDERVPAVGWASGGAADLLALVDWWWNRGRLVPNPPGAGFNPEEQFLLNQLSAEIAASCEPYRVVEAAARDPVGDLGAIDCFPKDPGIEDVGLFRFTSSAAIAAWYERRVAEVGLGIGSGGCLDGSAGETAWERGRIACYRSPTSKLARIRWTDDGQLIYGVLNARGSSDLERLLGWWNNKVAEQ